MNQKPCPKPGRTSTRPGKYAGKPKSKNKPKECVSFAQQATENDNDNDMVSTSNFGFMQVAKYQYHGPK